MNKSLLRQSAILHPAEIMQPYDAIYQAYGFDVVYDFVEHFGGLTIYVPNIRKVFSGCLEQEARKEFNGFNVASLSKKYGYTERHLRRIVGQA